MKCQILFSEKNKKNISICHLLKILTRMTIVKPHHTRTSQLICSRCQVQHVMDVFFIFFLEIKNNKVLNVYSTYLKK